MATPRKFSEKIALHTQKQAEETAAFEQIMREVTEATNKSALSNLEEMKCGRDTPIVYRERGRSMGVGGPMRPRGVEKRVDTSPYSSGPYLSPPPADNGWRRTNSDSALHTSAQTTDSLHSPGSQRRVMDSHTQMMDNHHHDSRRHLSVSPDGRPRSCCDVPRVPGINIFPSAQEPGTIQIPIGNNTGSLPDLTSFQFSSPLPTPLDQEDHTGSPYSNNHLSVPSQLNSRFLHKCKGVTLDNSGGGGMMYQTQRGNSPQQPLSPCSPLAQTSPVPVVDYVNSLNSYRSPHPVHRPSPQSSPGLTVKYGSVSPLSSSPQSPSSPASTGPMSFPEHSNYYISQAQANALQQHFEQFTMGVDWCQLVHTLVEGSPTWTAHIQMDNPGSIEYIGSTNNTSPYSQTEECTQELTPDPGYFSTSPSQQLQYSTRQTTPNTPSSIPDIVLTDFSSTDEIASRAEAELAKELNCAITGSFDSDLFPSDDCLREGLGTIDFDGLQMLTDPSEIITDPNAEEHFRLDRIQ